VWRPAPFEAEAGEAGEEWGSRVRRRVEEKTGQRGGVGDVDRHGTDAAAPGLSDSGGWCTPHGHGGRATNRGGRQGASDVGTTADKWGRAVVGPGGQRRGMGRQERVGSMAAAAATQDRQHNAARFGFKPIQTESKLFQTDSKFSKL
jgi:hypothetical protein